MLAIKIKTGVLRLSIKLLFFGFLGVFLITACATSSIRFIGATIKPEARFYFPCPEKAVALTIDDGPDLEYTESILRVLETYGATATFFVVGERAEPTLIKLIAESSSELGNHAYSEQSLTRLSDVNAMKSVRDTHNLLEQLQNMRWFRPPKGRYNNTVLEQINVLGYELVLGDVYPFDHVVSSAKFNTWYINTYIKNGSIIVLHEENGRGAGTLETLEVLLPKLHERDYHVQSLSELSESPGCKSGGTEKYDH